MTTPDLEATAKALLEQASEYSSKRNAKGKVNGHSATAVQKRCIAKLVVAGWTNDEAWSMTVEARNACTDR